LARALEKMGNKTGAERELQRFTDLKKRQQEAGGMAYRPN